jgi:hypothetical protein
MGRVHTPSDFKGTWNWGLETLSRNDSICCRNYLSRISYRGTIFKENRYCCRTCVSRISYRGNNLKRTDTVAAIVSPEYLTGGTIFKIGLGDMHCKRVWNWILLPQDWGASAELQPSPELLGNSEFLARVNDCKLFKDTLARSMEELSFPWRCGYTVCSIELWHRGFLKEISKLLKDMLSLCSGYKMQGVFSCFVPEDGDNLFFQNVNKHYQLTQHHKP